MESKMKKNIFLLVVFLLCLTEVFSQGNKESISIDSALSVVKGFYSHNEKKTYDQFHLPEKCGTWVHQFIRSQWNNLSLLQQKEYNQLVSGLTYDTSIIRGQFQIFYFKSGTNGAKIVNQVGDSIGSALAYAESVGVYLNYAKEIEIDSLGYLPPLVGSIAVHLEDLNNLYGFTDGFSITIDNDFLRSEYPTYSVNAAKVTEIGRAHV